MIADEFRIELKNNRISTIDELNKYIHKLKKPSLEFKCELYQFTWTTLFNIMSKENNCSYSKKNKIWIDNESQKTTINENKEEKNMSMTEKRILDNLQNRDNSEKVSTTIRYSKSINDRIDNIIKDTNAYSRNQFIVDLIELGLEEIESQMN